MKKRPPAGTTRTEAKLKDLKIWLSPITGIVYAGYTNAAGTEAIAKIDVTNRVIEAAATYLEHQGGGLEFENGAQMVLIPPGKGRMVLPRGTDYCQCADQSKALFTLGAGAEGSLPWCTVCQKHINNDARNQGGLIFVDK